MKYRTALKQMGKEMEFLGIDWEHLMNLINESPLIFSERTLQAYKVIQQHDKY